MKKNESFGRGIYCQGAEPGMMRTNNTVKPVKFNDGNVQKGDEIVYLWEPGVFFIGDWSEMKRAQKKKNRCYIITIKLTYKPLTG